MHAGSRPVPMLIPENAGPMSGRDNTSKRRTRSMSSSEARSNSSVRDGGTAGVVLALYRRVVASQVARWAAMPLRLIVGYGFAEHGFAKLLRGPDNFAGLLHALGVPMAHVFAGITILTEILGGILVLAGALVPLVSIPMAIVLLWRSSRCTFPTDFRRSSLWKSRRTARALGNRGTKPTCCILPAFSYLCWEAAGRSLSMAGSSGDRARGWRGASAKGATAAYSSHGLNSGTSNDAKSLTLRVTSVRPLPTAVAAKNPSMTESATPPRLLHPNNPPHRPAP